MGDTYLPLGTPHLVAAIAVGALLVVAYVFRQHIVGYLDRLRMHQRYQAASSFQHDYEAGLHSDTFSLDSNLANNDPRSLDEHAVGEIQAIMDEEGVSFDEARLRYTQSEFDRNGVDRNGLPRDPRLVTLSV